MTFDTVLVQPEGCMQISVPRFTLPNGRSARRANVTYVPQKYLEMVLFNRTDGGSSGAIYKILGRTGQDKTAWLINKAAVQSNELSQAHADFIMQTFKDLMPSNDDAVLGGRTRNVTLLPLRTAIIVCQTRGRSPSTTAFLRACAPDDEPDSWKIRERAEELDEDEVDPLLEDELEEAEDADAYLGISFADAAEGQRPSELVQVQGHG